MTLTTHATVGTLIGYTLGNPLAGFIVGFLSHLLLDMIPHGDYKMNINFRKNKSHMKKALAFVTTDAIVAIFFILWLISWKDLSYLPAISWAIAGAVLPDLIVGLHDLTKNKWLKPLNDLHFYFHNLIVKKHKDIPLQYSLTIQFILIIILQSQL